jgi:hypothetical protein
VHALLKIVEGNDKGEEIALHRGGSVTVGRSHQAMRRLQDEHLSRVHACFDWTGDACVVRDLNSRNGVFVNGAKVERHSLRSGDRVKIGGVVFEVSFRDEPPPVPKEHEETRNLLEQTNHCEHCQRPITLATFADGDVKEKDGRYLCPDCATILDLGSDEFKGFKVLERLGAGTAGLVFRARQLFQDRIVALKVLRLNESLSEKQVVRFLREAATISRLDHPHIVKVFDAVEFDKGYYIVMEYFAGKDLLTLVETRGAASSAIAVSIGMQLASALTYASKQGIVHRDLKPANILYRAEDGLAKLSDFGLAKRLGRSSWIQITREGEGLGTPCYMPPEQVRDARNVDPRADIYSLGASLYHVLSGRFPLIAKSYSEFMKQVMDKDPPPLRTANPRVPPELAEVVAQAMRKDPKERFQTAAEMLKALEAVRRRYSYPEPPIPPDDRI